MLRLKKFMEYIKSHDKTFCFAIVFLIIIIINLKSKDSLFYYDSSNYWTLADNFIRDGKFNLLFYNATRGYAFPLALLLIKLIALGLRCDSVIVFKIVSALFFSCFFSKLIPSLFEKLLDKKISIIKNLSFSFLMIYFWRGYFIYPLSDFVALFCLVLIIYFNLMLNNKNLYPIFFIGILLAIVTSVRPSYEILIMPVIIYAVFLIVRSNKSKIIMRLSILILSLIVGFLPQLYINYNYFKVIDPFVVTDSLYLKQLGWGINVQKYETNIGTDYKAAGVDFNDPQGESIMKRENISSISSYIEYVKLVIKYPVDFICIYSKHLFNGLDITYHTPYVGKIYENRIMFSMINYSIWFVAIAMLIKMKKKVIENKKFIINGILLILPSLLSLPGAIEIRFFLPFYLIAYSIICYTNLAKLFYKNRKLYIRKYFIAYILFIIICFLISSNTFSNIAGGSYILNL